MKVSIRIFLFSLIINILFCTYQYVPYTFGWADPGWMILTTASIAEDGDIDLRNQLGNDPTGIADQVALGAHGEWYPIHEPMLSVLGVPFYWIFGVLGCLITNVLIASMIPVAAYGLYQSVVSRSAAVSAAVLVAYASPILFYTYSFSIDILGTLLATCALTALFQKRFLLAGALLGVSCMARITSIPLLGVFPLYVLMLPRGLKLSSLCLLCVGYISVSCVALLQNWIMFADPFMLPYQRQVLFIDGAVQFAHESVLRGRSLIDGIFAVTIYRPHGLFTAVPWSSAAVLGAIFLKNVRTSPEGLASLVGIAVYVVCAALYNGFPGGNGNRYMFTAYIMCGFCLSYLLDSLNAYRNSLYVR